MTSEPGGLVPVDTGLVLQTLIEAVVAKVQERRDEEPSAAITEVLEASVSLAGDNDPALDRGLRRDGYLARIAEADLFEPAQREAAWVTDVIRKHFAETGGWQDAITATCADIARAEPVGKPSPDDELALSWRVPGPGGHVRHFLARRAIEDRLREVEEPVDGDPAELKRPWLYGFFVRVCEEALPDEAVLDTEA